MKRQTKEKSEQEFQDRVTTLNNQIYSSLESQLGDLMMPQREVIVDRSITPKLATIIDSFDKNRGCLILVNPISDSLEEMEDYQIFQRMNPSSTPNDFLKSMLAHEYGHLIECGEQPSNRENYHLPPRINTPKSIETTLILISEAFAFWFADTFTGFKTFSQEVLETYTSELSDPNNVRRYLSLIDNSEALEKQFLEQELKCQRLIKNLYDNYSSMDPLYVVKNRKKIVEGLLR